MATEGWNVKRLLTKSTIRVVAGTAIAIFWLQAVALPVSAKSLPVPYIAGTAGILVERDSGRVLWALNPDKRESIASTTKMMTALVAADKLPSDSDVEINPGVLAVDESGVGFKRGEKLTASQLLYSMLLYSANDAATAIANKVAGSPKAFAELMNERAHALGLKNTHFVNPHGLDTPGHYSTARDLSAIARELLRNPVLSKIVSTKTWVLNRKTGPKTLQNTNQLLAAYRYATGVKTGHTEKAGYCLVSSAKKDRTELVAVVLGVPQDYAAPESKRLLEYGFSLYSNKRLATEGHVLKSVALPYGKKVRLAEGKDFTSVVREGAVFRTEIHEREFQGFPLRKGERLGEIVFLQDGKALGSVPLVADRFITAPSFTEKISYDLHALYKKLIAVFH